MYFVFKKKTFAWFVWIQSLDAWERPSKMKVNADIIYLDDSRPVDSGSAIRECNTDELLDRCSTM